MPRPRVCVLRTAGTNCDRETAFSFSLSGALSQLVHINSLINNQFKLSDFQILAIPGGFSYGDDVAAGKILANELRYKLSQGFKEFIEAGKLVIGICNGFQVLVKSGFLPYDAALRQRTSLIINDSGKFEDRWVHLRKTQNKCVWTKGLPEVISLPVAHGEGKFIVKDRALLKQLEDNGQIVFQYCDEAGNASAGYPFNPNGSEDNIAGICDHTGRVLGLMPHPERHIKYIQHPAWYRKGRDKQGQGLQIFRNAVDYIRKNI